MVNIKDRGINLEYFNEHIKPNDHLIVDIRTESERSEVELSDDSFIIDKDDVPYDSREVPFFFRTLPVVILCSDGTFSKQVVDNYMSSDGQFESLYYFIDGHKGLKND